MQHLSEKDTVM